MFDLVYPVVVVLLWTLLIRTIPSVLSKSIEKRVEYRLNRKLEEVKADLQGSYSTVGKSVDFLSAVQPEVMSKMTHAVEKLWTSALAIRKHHGAVLLLDDLFLPEEIDERIKSKSSGTIWEILDEYKDQSFLLKMADTLREFSNNTERLFVSDRLWILYMTTVRVCFRYAILLNKSIKNDKYVDWRHDDVFISNLQQALSNEIIDAAKDKKFGGLHNILTYLEAEFLKEGRSVIGSKRFSEAFSDIQATLNLSINDIKQQRDLRT